MNDKERKAFEAWYEAARMPCEANWFRRDLENPDEYDSVITHNAWEGWMAAKAASAVRIRELEDLLRGIAPGYAVFSRS